MTLERHDDRGQSVGPVLTSEDIRICKDMAFVRMMQMPANEQTRATYESLTHLNNTELVGNLLVTRRRIEAGGEILLTKGWGYYEQHSPRTQLRISPRGGVARA